MRSVPCNVNQWVLFLWLVVLLNITILPPPAYGLTEDELLSISKSYFDAKDYENAIAACDKALKMNPNFINGYFGRGVIFSYREEFDKALADFNMVLQLEPQNASAYTYRASIYRAKGQYGQALADYSLVIFLQPQNAEAYMNRGSLLRLNGNQERATADFNAAMRLNPQLRIPQ